MAEIMEQKQKLMQFWKEYFRFHPDLLGAFSVVQRENFISKSVRDVAYEDRPLPLLRGKTISQPTTVMIMTAALEPKKGDRVFEIGTGSGYQAALLGILVEPGKVITTEVIPELVQFARENLAAAAIKNVIVFEEDGSKGMESEAPFDKVIITAACREFPKPVVDQLKEGGIIIGPVGDPEQQQMIRGTKIKGKLELEFLGPFLFTPMYGKYGFDL
ncbi:MAG TPA: protein-L-isoaspartate(D-aspartate) O-methyltransferase [Candidatus Nanoarchaeia archaeon]|nr:protein-L-isoaspartate(D-aspartate) O-methyltransferase [Candidatus Nanoarchaeia archaeon]